MDIYLCIYNIITCLLEKRYWLHPFYIFQISILRLPGMEFLFLTIFIKFLFSIVIVFSMYLCAMKNIIFIQNLTIFDAPLKF